MWVKTWRRCRREMCRDLGENRVGKKPKQRPKGWRVLVCLGDCLLLSFWNSGVETTSGVTQRATAGSRPQRRSRAGRVPMGGNVRAQMCKDAEECLWTWWVLDPADPEAGHPGGSGHATVTLSIWPWRQNSQGNKRGLGWEQGETPNGRWGKICSQSPALQADSLPAEPRGKLSQY